MLLSVIHDKVHRRKTLEHGAHARLQVVEKQRLIPLGKVRRNTVDDGGRRVVGAVHVRTVDHNGERLPDRVLRDEVPHVVYRREDQAAIGRDDEVLGSTGTLLGEFEVRFVRVKKLGTLTVNRSTEIFGLAAWYRIKITFKPTPTRIPISRGSAKQAMNVLSPGIKSLSGRKHCLVIVWPPSWKNVTHSWFATWV